MWNKFIDGFQWWLDCLGEENHPEDDPVENFPLVDMEDIIDALNDEWNVHFHEAGPFNSNMTPHQMILWESKLIEARIRKDLADALRQ